MKKIKMIKNKGWKLAFAFILIAAGIYGLTIAICLLNILYFIEALAIAGYVLTYTKPNTSESGEPCSSESLLE